MRRPCASALLALVLGTSACAYYNGLYNANRLAGEARRAEREGRTGEARSLWSQAAVKAESVASRFPDSKWRDDALLLQGEALLRIDACTRAVEPLQLAADSSPDPALRSEARIALGRCRVFMREPDAARPPLTAVIEEGDSLARDRAYLWRGRALLDLGRPATALADLERSTQPEAAFPRAIALARLDRAADGASALSPQVDGPFDEDRWRAALDTVGLADPAEASGLAVALARRSDLTPGQRGRLLVADGERWMAAGDTATAATRFRRAVDVAGDSVEARVARAWLGVQAVHAAREPEIIDSVRRAMQAAIREGGRPVQIAGRYVAVLDRVAAALEAEPPDELLLFVAAEAVRDTLRATDLAGGLFLALARRHDESVLAPKALLAASRLRPALRDSLLQVVMTRYAESAYALALRGEGGARFEAVEDSLAAALATRRESPR